MTNKFLRSLFLISVLFIFVFVGCGGSSNNATTPGTTTGNTVSGTMSTTSKGKLKLPSKGALKLRKGKNGKISHKELKRQKAIASAMAKRFKKQATAYVAFANASVTLFDVETGDAISTDTTDTNGGYDLTNIPDGKSYVIVGVKYDVATGDVITQKIALSDTETLDKDGDGKIDMPNCNPETTLAAQEYVNQVKDAADTNGDGTIGADELTSFDPDSVDYEKYWQKFEEMDDTALLQLWNSYDKDADALAVGSGGDVNAMMDNSIYVASDELDLVGEMISSADANWETAMQTALGTDYQAKLDQLNTLLETAYSTLETTLAGIDAQASTYESDYYKYLADELTAIGVSGVTSATLAENFNLSNANLDTVLATSTSQNEIDAAYQRYSVEQQVIGAGADLADVDTDLDSLEAAYEAALDACGSPCDYSTASQTITDAIWAAQDDLWNYAEKYSLDVAASILKIVVSDVDFDAISAVMMDGSNCVSTNGHDIRCYDANNDGTYEAIVDYTEIEATALAAAGTEPTQPDWTTATSDAIQAYYDAENTYWTAYDAAYSSAESPQMEVLIIAMGISWGSSASELDAKMAEIKQAQETAWNNYDDATNVFISTYGASYDAAWAAYDQAITDAYTAAGLSQTQVDTAYASAYAAYWTTVDVLNASGLISGDILASLGNSYESGSSIDTNYVQDIVDTFSQLKASESQLLTIKNAAFDLQNGSITQEQFDSTAEQIFKDILTGRGIAEQSVNTFITTVDNSATDLQNALTSATTADTVNIAYAAYNKAIETAVSALNANNNLMPDEALAIVQFFILTDSQETGTVVKNKVLHKTA